MLPLSAFFNKANILIIIHVHNKNMNTTITKKIFAIIGIVFTVVHLVYYLYAKYDALYFFLGFGLLWLLFVAPIKYLHF